MTQALQRLIVQYTLSDGCTYSTTYTEPALGESPEAFLAALQEAWKAHMAEKTVISKEIQKLERVLHPLQAQIYQLGQDIEAAQAKPGKAAKAGKAGHLGKVQAIVEKNAAKAKETLEKLLPQWEALRLQIDKLNQQRNQLAGLVVGGCRFDAEDLAYRPNAQEDPQFDAPNVMTLDEFFVRVEAIPPKEQSETELLSKD